MLPSEPKISWPEVTKFIGQLNHDLRNHLNGVELQSAFLGEIVEDAEAKAEIKRLREMTGDLGAHLQKLSATLGRIQPETMPYPAADFVEDLRAKLTLAQPEQSAAIEWNISLGKEMLEIDPQILADAFVELLANADAHGRGEGPLVFGAHGENGTVEFSLREPKAAFDESTDDWGTRPFQRVRSGHYSLGLFRARGIFEAHHAQYRVHFDPAASILETNVSFPTNRLS
jgi:light-regulated signal transduction histidine kinase (bacteriophytochrome)